MSVPVRWLRSRRTITVVVAVVVLGVLGGGYAAYAAQSGKSGHYRTATVKTGDVQETLSLSGTITPTRRSDVAFATSGTVDSVAVEVGEKVAKGSVLARLDTTELVQEVTRAEADVASARAQLASDEEAAATVATAADAQPSGGSAGTQALMAAVASAQKACAAGSAPTGSATGGSTGDAGQPTASASPSAVPSRPGSQTTPTGGKSGLSGASGTCASALAAIEQAARQLSSSQSSDQEAAAGGFSGGAASTVTAATIARDEASVAEAQSSLVSAKVALKAAVIKAPRGGTVAEVDVTSGGSATAGTVAVTVIAPGTTIVTLDATATQVKKLSVGQKATVTPAGDAGTYGASVTAVSNVPSSSSGSDTTYPVTVTLRKRGLALLTGVSATVDVVVGAKAGVLTVPTSAVSDGVVTVLEHGTATRTRVTTGLVGAALTEVTDGLDAGATVVLADLDADLPTGDSTTTGTSRPTFGGSTGFSQFGGRG